MKYYGKLHPLHIAVLEGSAQLIVNSLLSNSNLLGLKDYRGNNILHLMAHSKKSTQEQIDFNRWVLRDLIPRI